MKEVIFSKAHPKGLVREVDDKKHPPHPPHPHENVEENKGTDITLLSPNGTRYKLTVSDNGKLAATKV